MHVLDRSKLPLNFPTHCHSAEFWVALGRAVATFGFLEEVLGKEIFAFPGMREIPDDAVEAELERWFEKLERALSDPLGALINAYEKAVKENSDPTKLNIDTLLTDLREAATRRKVICHGSWRMPDEAGASKPFFVSNMMKIWDTPIDIAHLNQHQRFTVGLICGVVDSVSFMGWSFPGSNGPGQQVFRRDA